VCDLHTVQRCAGGHLPPRRGLADDRLIPPGDSGGLGLRPAAEARSSPSSPVAANIIEDAVPRIEKPSVLRAISASSSPTHQPPSPPRLANSPRRRWSGSVKVALPWPFERSPGSISSIASSGRVEQASGVGEIGAAPAKLPRESGRGDVELAEHRRDRARLFDHAKVLPGMFSISASSTDRPGSRAAETSAGIEVIPAIRAPRRRRSPAIRSNPPPGRAGR
jgi:hypothetical protein